MSPIKKELHEENHSPPSLSICGSWLETQWKNDVFPHFFYHDPQYLELRNVKNKIEEDLYSKKWDDVKKYCNEYEYIHISSSRSKRPENVAFYIPLSRSYFKLWELIFDYNLIYKSSLAHPIWKSAHLAEGPGGFVEAVCKYREVFKLQQMTDVYHTITLKAIKKEIPGFNRNNYFLKNHSNIYIHYGEDDTGDLYNPNNIRSFIAATGGPRSCNLVTADGGFDFSIDFNCQEYLSIRLIISQIITALQLLMPKGCFVLKIFDSYLQPTIELLWILTQCFEELHLVKPVTSRPTNSEKYVVGIGFKSCPEKVIQFFTEYLQNQWDQPTPAYIHSFFNRNFLTSEFITRIKEYNDLHTYKQLSTTKKIIGMIDYHNENDLKILISHHINLCVEWCFKYRVPINRQCKYINYIQPKYLKSLGL